LEKLGIFRKLNRKLSIHKKLKKSTLQKEDEKLENLKKIPSFQQAPTKSK
jgi:hypothetical protein